MKISKKRKILIYDVLIIVLIITLIILGYNIASYFVSNQKSQKKISDLKSMVVSEEDASHDNSEQITEGKNEDIEKDEKAIAAKFENLYEKNSDFIGWITIEDTNIDYPVMQTIEDNQFYLHRDFNKEYDFAGLIFADNRCDIKEPADNIILYGHNMKIGTMFAGLLKYSDREYCESHKIINFDTIYESRQYEVFAAFKAKVYDENDETHFKYYDFIDASTEEEFDEYIEQIMNMSYYDENSPEFGDEILTLSTCDNSDDDSRFVVMARRIDK